MAVGWAKDGAVQDEIDSAVENALDRVRREASTGDGLLFIRLPFDNCHSMRREIATTRLRSSLCIMA